ncbi:hypothetical protein [Corynebacterium glyciniphilum]|uniref:hypothetical protein n=1 Tax=Corynebacterium glyciniphilum TaxID=1404244 RepID=UPI003FD24FC5
MIETDGIVVALCHLRHGSISVTRGQLVDVGAAVAECGNTGNSTEPHRHLQAVQGPDVARGNPVAVTFHGTLPRNGDIV